jgi:WG containing repeat
MKSILIIIFLIINNIILFSSEPLCAYRTEGLWHFIDTDGNPFIEPMELYSCDGFGEGFYRVRKLESGRLIWSFLDKNGKEIFRPKCDILMDFRDGMAMTIQEYPEDKDFDRRYGFVNTKGEQVVPIKYLDVTSFSEGLAFVTDYKEHGYIDSTGIFVIKLPEKIVGYNFSEGLAPVSNADYKVGYIDKTGKVVIPYIYDEPGLFSEGKAKVTINGKTGLMDRDQNIILEAKYFEVSEFSEGMAFAAIPGQELRFQWALLDSTGNILTEHKYLIAEKFSEGLSCVKDEDNWHFLDKSGTQVIENLASAGSFSGGLAWAIRKNSEGSATAGFINKKGEFVIELDNFTEVLDLRINKRVFTTYVDK